jgi:hypothetical protein
MPINGPLDDDSDEVLAPHNGRASSCSELTPDALDYSMLLS